MNKVNRKTPNLLSSKKKQDTPVMLNMSFEQALKKALQTRLLLKSNVKKGKDTSS